MQEALGSSTNHSPLPPPTANKTKQSSLGNVLNKARSQLRSTGRVDRRWTAVACGVPSWLVISNWDCSALQGRASLCICSQTGSLCSLLHPLPGPWIKNEGLLRHPHPPPHCPLHPLPLESSSCSGGGWPAGSAKPHRLTTSLPSQV